MSISSASTSTANTHKKNPTTPSLLQEIISCLEEHKAQEIHHINVQETCQFTDWMIFCTGSSKRHTKSLSDYLCEEHKKRGNTFLSSEGTEVGEWIIVDFVDIVVHIMQPQIREFYALEKLWFHE